LQRIELGTQLHAERLGGPRRSDRFRSDLTERTRDLSLGRLRVAVDGGDRRVLLLESGSRRLGSAVDGVLDP
jgi:hypothetical protein